MKQPAVRFAQLSGWRSHGIGRLRSQEPAVSFTTPAEQPGASVPAKAPMKNCWSGDPANVGSDVLAAPGRAAMALWSASVTPGSGLQILSVRWPLLAPSGQ